MTITIRTGDAPQIEAFLVEASIPDHPVGHSSIFYAKRLDE
jgi:hypothetical protein